MAERRSYVLDELDTSVQKSCSVEMTEAEAAALVATRLVDVRRTANPSRWDVLATDKVGAVRVGDLQVEVRPKGRLGLAHLLFLLGYARDPGFRDEAVAGDRDGDLWPALAYSLAQSVERALARGPLMGYCTTDEALATVRGRIRFGDQIRARPGFAVPVEVTYDEYTVDIVENRLLRGALARILVVPGIDAEVRGRLQRLHGRLDGVMRLPHGTPLPHYHRNRLNSRYHGALTVAEIVLAEGAVKPGRDGVEVASFVVTMWSVFEDFVTVALREALRVYPGHTTKQHPAHFTMLEGRPRLPMAVDILHLSPTGDPQIIFDAKYKLAHEGAAHGNADFYQMHAYSTALGLDRAWLVYAGGGPAATHEVVGSGGQVCTYPLDLGKEPTDLLSQVRDLAARASISGPPASRTPDI